MQVFLHICIWVLENCIFHYKIHLIIFDKEVQCCNYHLSRKPSSPVLYENNGVTVLFTELLYIDIYICEGLLNFSHDCCYPYSYSCL